MRFCVLAEELLQSFDALFVYNMVTWQPKIMADFETNVDECYATWYDAATEIGVDFVPDVLPGYDDRLARPQSKTPELEKTADRLRNQISIAKRYQKGTLV